jgi:hypothetical protein
LSRIVAIPLLGLGTRQTRRLLAAYRDGGGGAMIHKARGRTSNNQLIAGIREYVIEVTVAQHKPTCGSDSVPGTRTFGSAGIVRKTRCWKVPGSCE